MELQLAAKGTKPGSKANARKKKAGANGYPTRVPIGTLHYVDNDEQSAMTSMFVAVCGEGSLVAVDAPIDDDFDNERCPTCEEKRWAADFNEMQKGLLK